MTDRLVPRAVSASGIAGRLAERLHGLADQVLRLAPPSSRNPEGFHIAKSELVGELRRLARDASGKLPAE